MYSALYYYATRLRSAGLLPEGFSIQELIDAARTQGCELKDRAIYNNFEAARHGDDHPFFAKLDPSAGARSWNVQISPALSGRCRGPASALQSASASTKRNFEGDPDTIIGFEVFAEAPLGSESAKALELALEPLI